MTEYWKKPQKLAPKTPETGDGRWPVVFCFRCDLPCYELVRDDHGQRLEECSSVQQIYLVLSDPSNPTNDGSRLRIALCGDCAASFGPDQYTDAMELVISGLEEDAKRGGLSQEAVNRVRLDLGAAIPVAHESYEEGQRKVAVMLEEKRQVVQRLIRDAILKERAERSAAYKAAKDHTKEGRNAVH